MIRKKTLTSLGYPLKISLPTQELSFPTIHVAYFLFHFDKYQDQVL